MADTLMDEIQKRILDLENEKKKVDTAVRQYLKLLRSLRAKYEKRIVLKNGDTAPLKIGG